jgi:hypothetical protein
MRRAGLLLDQLTNALSAAAMALSASSLVADAAFQHGWPDFGFMISKVDKLDSSIPLIHRGTTKLVLLSVSVEVTMSKKLYVSVKVFFHLQSSAKYKKSEIIYLGCLQSGIP